jgi:hypothetical protein
MHHFPFYSKKDEIADIDGIDFWRKNAVDPGDHPNDHVMEKKVKGTRKTYAPSKLAALLFSLELNRRYGGNYGVRSIAVNPGSVNSDIWRNYPSFMKAIFNQIYLTPEQGCSTSVAASVMDFDEDVIYLQPYWLPHGSTRRPFPMFEMLGPFIGYQPTQPRLPDDDGAKASESLFAVCEELTGCMYPAALARPPLSPSSFSNN